MSFMAIGVSDSAEELLGRHPSIQRCVARIRLPLLPTGAVEHIVAQGAAFAGLYFPNAARSSIAELARGVPYVAQLLSLRAGQSALQGQRLDVRGGDLITAIIAAVAEADPRVTSLYRTLTASESDTAVMRLLRSAAVGHQDEFGRFTVRYEGPLLRVAGAAADPGAWQRVIDTGAIRPGHGDDAGRFTFSEPMLPHLVMQRAVLLQAVQEMPRRTFSP